jgi:hypothetical protein
VKASARRGRWWAIEAADELSAQSMTMMKMKRMTMTMSPERKKDEAQTAQM